MKTADAFLDEGAALNADAFLDSGGAANADVFLDEPVAATPLRAVQAHIRKAEPKEPAETTLVKELVKGFETGVTGMHQMGAAAAAVPVVSALENLDKRLELYDKVDAGQWQPSAPKKLGATPSYAEQQAALYARATPETRKVLREDALRSVGGNAEVRDTLLAVWKQFSDHMQQTQGAVPNFTDAWKTGEFGKWFAFNFGQALPYSAAFILAGLAGGTPALIAAGTALGAGDIASEQLERGRAINPREAAAGAVPYGALELVGVPAQVLKAFRGVTPAVLDGIAKSYLGRLGRAVPEAAAREFLNEVGQEIVKDVAIQQRGEELVTDESLVRWFNSGMAGVAGGAPHGAVAAIPGPDSAKRGRAKIAARELKQAVEATDISAGTEQIAVDLLAPENAQLRAVPKAAPAAPQQAEKVAVEVPTPAETAPATAQERAGATLEPASIPEPPPAAPAAVAPPDEAEQPAEVFAIRGEANMAARLMTNKYKTHFKAVPHPAQEGAWTVEQVQRTEAQQAADKRSRQRAVARLRPDETRDTITTFIAKLGGLRLSEAPDITRDRYPVRAPNAPMLFLIRRNGGMGVDEVGEYLAEAGYFAERPDEQEIRDAIKAELDGRMIYSVYGAEHEQSQRDKAEVERELAAVEFAEQAGIAELEQVSTPEDLALTREFVPAAESELTGPRLALAELTARAVALDEAATERLAIQSEGMTDEQYAVALQEIINANEQDVAGRDRGVGEAHQPFALAGETESEREARQAGERARSDRERREAEERGARARADREREAFGLTASEREADVAAAAGQEGLKYAIGPAFSDDFLVARDPVIAAVRGLAKQIAPTADVAFADKIFVEPSATAPPGALAVGSFNPATNLITVALNYAQPEQALRHEAVHFLRANNFFTPQEWRVLERESRKTWMRGNNTTDVEEAVAYAFGDYRAGRLDALPPVQRVLRKIADFLQRLGNLLRGMGFNSPESIFAKVEAGEVGRREPGAGIWQSPDGIKYALGPNAKNPPTPAVQQAYVVSAQRALRQRMASPSPNSWEADTGILKRLFVTPRTIAAFDRDFVPVYQTAVEQWKFRDQLIARFETEAEPYFKASKEDQAAVNKILEHDRLTGQVALAGKNMTVHFTSPQAVLTKPGERLTVTDAQKTAYWAVRSMLNSALNEFRDQTLEDLGLPAGTTAAQAAQMAAQATNKADATRLLKVADILQGIEDARRTGYVPFNRYGEIGISVRNRLTGALIHYESIEVGLWQRRGGKQLGAMPEVKARLEALRRQYPGQAVSDPFQVPKAGMPPQVKLEEVDALAEIAKIDNATWDGIRKKLEQAVASQGFRAHFFRARNIPGYSVDFERSLANYVNGIAGYLARRRYAPKWVAAIAPISANKSRLRQYAQDYQAYVNSPVEEFAALRGLNFVYYLTSIATWLVNLTQVPFVSMPWASQFTSALAVSGAFARAEAETAAMLTLTKGVQLYSAAKAPADVRDAVQQAYEQGLFIPITTYESMGIARNQGRRLRKLSKTGQLTMEIFGLGFTAAERHNRIATFIALYRLGRDRPEVVQNFGRVMARNALASSIVELDQRGRFVMDPAKFAEFGIDETHFKAGKVNRPTLARGPGTLVFQFKMFTWNMLERMVTMGVLQGTEGRAAVVLMLTVIGTIAGVWGLPFAEDMRDLWELYMRKVKNREVNADAEMRKAIVELTGSARTAQAVSGGAPRALPEPWNIDLSKRIGLGNIIPNSAGEALGVTFDLWGKRPMAAMEQYEMDNLLLALAEVMPKQAADIMAQLNWARSGVRSRSSDQPVIPPEQVTTGMRVAKGIGFTPGGVANIREAERAKQIAVRAVDEQRKVFYRLAAKAAAELERADAAGNQVAALKAEAALVKVGEDIEKWNAEHPDDEDQVMLDAKSMKRNLIKEFLGADYDKGKRRQARGEIERLRQVYGR